MFAARKKPYGAAPIFLGGGVLLGWLQELKNNSFALAESAETPENLSCQYERRKGHTIIYRNKNEFMKKREAFMNGGSSSLQVISDFDFTLTKFHVAPGQRGASCHCIIEDSGFLPDHYRTQAKALLHYYYPLESSPTLSLEEKIPLMQEWVEKSHELILQSKLRRPQVRFAVSEALRNDTIALRDGVSDLLLHLHRQNIPFLLFSAGLADVIEEMLAQKCRDIESAHIVSNHMVFDDDVLVGFSSPSYHVFNKKAKYALDTSPFFQGDGLKQRKHLLLLGDSLGDASMCEGLDVLDHNKIKIGFLNDKAERLPDYLEAFDVVILGDPNFEYISSLIEDITGKRKQIA